MILALGPKQLCASKKRMSTLGEQIRGRPFLQGAQPQSTRRGEHKEVWISALIPSCREQSHREVLTPSRPLGEGRVEGRAQQASSAKGQTG